MKDLFANYYNNILISAVISWSLAQILKTIINYLVTKKFKIQRLIGSGGMPSAHSAFVSSAAVAVFRKSGVSSPEFAIIVIVAMVVMYDAMGVRMQSGIHAKEINKINKSINDKKEINSKELDEYLGHKPIEVFCGAILGIFVALVVPII